MTDEIDIAALPDQPLAPTRDPREMDRYCVLEKGGGYYSFVFNRYGERGDDGPLFKPGESRPPVPPFVSDNPAPEEVAEHKKREAVRVKREAERNAERWAFSQGARHRVEPERAAECIK